ncbi:hypothetical protein GCM10023185_09870 [Hymenobacter saemangeumensis]|uniref:N-end rule aminoacyl transferase C-terminal domain-containing protein n=2 Tax=Hymenobacter saemangeumensis TaxID=1084522 RepID=A0ABP8I4N9_9BACT
MIRGEALDFYLSRGYYRMQQNLFTCDFVPFDGRVYTAHWLRLNVAGVGWGAEQRRLLRRNAHLTTVIRPFRPNAGYEELYARYRQSISFDASPTVEEVLLGGEEHNAFNTQVMEVYEGPKLIAAGIFDYGARTLAGIVNFYDPAYRRHSLGKYLMLLKIEHARQLALDYYYPGYVLHDYPKFDYKLFPSLEAAEVYDSVRGRWLPFAWATVAAHSAELLAEWLPEELREKYSQ